MALLLGEPTRKHEKSRTLVMFHQRDMKDARKGYALVCFGPKGHYREDGSCPHTREIMERMKPWHRSRVRLHRFGEMEHADE